MQRSTAPSDALASSVDELLLRWREPLGRITPCSKPCKAIRDGVRYWWFRPLDEIEPFKASLHSSSEALALLETLRRVDAQKVEEFLSGLVCRQRIADRFTPRILSCVADDEVVFGMEFGVLADDLGPVSERVFGVQAPSPRFEEDYAHLTKLSGYDVHYSTQRRERGIPVSLHLGATDAGVDPKVYAYLLREVLQLVMAQQVLHAQDCPRREAWVASRFYIVELRFNWLEDGFTAINGEALQYLAQLCQRGIRIRGLPCIREDDDSPSSRLAIAEALLVLISPLRDIGFEWCRPKHIYVSIDSSPHIVPMIFSAIQTSSSVKCVHLQARLQIASGALPSQRDAARRAILQWTAYTLFSRHAQHSVEIVDVDCTLLDGGGIEQVCHLLSADDPLGVLFETSSSRRQQNEWLSVSTFFTSPQSTDDISSGVYELKAVIRVRTIESVERLGEKWSRVLLPGYGDAWVAGRMIQALRSRDVSIETKENKGLHLKFFNIVESDEEAIATLLPLIHGDVTGFELSSADDMVSIDTWVTQVFSACPKLHTLSLSGSTELHGLGSIVACAAAGECRLRRLDVCCTQDVDTADLFRFLGVLCNKKHPLTKNLEELKLVMTIEHGSEHEVALHIRRMLASNRRIRSLRVETLGSELKMEVDQPVAIRSGPLDIRSKLAFLRAVSELPYGGCLDSSVASIVFSFAAQHRLREVEIVFLA